MLNADNFATVRDFHGISQRKLADLLNVSQPYIAQIEAGSRPLSDNVRAKTTALLDLTPDKLAQIDAAQAAYDTARASVEGKRKL